MKMETSTFSCTNEDDITTTLTYTVPARGLSISSFHEMCVSFAKALGFREMSVERIFGNGDDNAFAEFME